MVNKLNIDNNELIVLMEFEDDEYQNIVMCLDEKNNKVYVIKNQIVTNKEIIDKINEKYQLELPQELKGVIF